MKLHRFYVPDTELKHNMWLRDAKLLHQWNNVLRFRAGQEVVLFDGLRHDRLYKIDELKKDAAHLLHVTDFERQEPKRNVYLLWSLLKKDKNDWVLQKATELGASHFLPLLADRSEKVGFNAERAERIVIEAAEQCGRSDIPTVREPMRVATAIEQLHDKAALHICEQGSEGDGPDMQDSVGVLIGPEGGWSDAEKQLFIERQLRHLSLGGFTLRAETAAIVATAMVI